MKGNDKKKGDKKQKGTPKPTGADDILETFNSIYNETDRRPNGDSGLQLLKCGPYLEWTDLPAHIKVKPFHDASVTPVRIIGPQDDKENKLENYSGVACAKTVSTYPSGQGEPICDHFSVELYMRRWLVAVADGCAWGNRPREAAIKAAAAYHDYLRENQKDITDVRDAGRLILRAFSKAHQRIIEGFDDVWEAGTTTLCAGIMLELEQDETVLKQFKEMEKTLVMDYSHFDLSELPAGSRLEKILLAQELKLEEKEKEKEQGSDEKEKEKEAEKEKEKEKEKEREKIKDEEENFYGRIGGTSKEPAAKSHKWVFVCASVGDCKCFHYSSATGLFVDITHGNRSNLTDAKDPGGRLGPYVGQYGDPDLRNLSLYIIPCYDDDQIIIMSDGVHDNLDPQNLGLVPKDLNFDFENWTDAESAACEKAADLKDYFRRQYLKRLVQLGNESLSRLPPEVVVGRLIDHSWRLTKNSRDFMENNPSTRLPDDYELYPGKMDHTTCVSIIAAGCVLTHPQGTDSSSAETEYGTMKGQGKAPQRNLAASSNSVYSSMSTARRGSEAQGVPMLVIPLRGMERENLGEIAIGPNDLITDTIYQIKHKLADTIGGRAFRLRKGLLDWSRKPAPILKKDFTRRAVDIFAAGDVIVVQIAPANFGKVEDEKEI